MRIEDTYSFPAPPEQALAALADADTLSAAIPGCERLIQFGPPAADGATHYEARLRLHDAVYTADLTVTPQPANHELRLVVDGRGPSGAFAGTGALTLTPAEGEPSQTVGAYTLDLHEPPGLSDTQLAALANGAGRLFVCALCDQISQDLRRHDQKAGSADAVDEEAADERLRGQRVERLMRAQTSYGEIVAAPREARTSFAPSPLWFQYAAGMLAGLAVGLSIIALTAATLRRLFNGDEHESEG
jgi:carbon monoxide dehydrogenase subunit G